MHRNLPGAGAFVPDSGARRGQWDDGFVALRFALAALALAALATFAGGPARPSSAATTAPGRPETECISANPRPDCVDTGEFDRSSRSHLLLFAVLGVALAGIAVVVVRSTIRRERAHHPSSPS
jgi:hypothetical protein